MGLRTHQLVYQCVRSARQKEHKLVDQDIMAAARRKGPVDCVADSRTTGDAFRPAMHYEAQAFKSFLRF